MTKKVNENKTVETVEKVEAVKVESGFTPEMDVKAALEKFSKVLEKSNELNEACNEQLKAVVGAMVGACFAFNKKPARLNGFLKKAFTLIGKSAVSKYKKNIADYIENACGIGYECDTYELSDCKALQKGADDLKTASIITYKSEKTEKAAAAAKLEKAEKKQAFLDASAHERVLSKILALKAEAQERKDKLTKVTDTKKRNGKEIDKTTEEIAELERVIAFLDQAK